MLWFSPAGLHAAVARPMGYCDHFALRRISDDDARADRLVAAIKASGGSLALSWLNLGEFATVTDRAQRLRAECLIERILPAVFPLDAAPLDVHARQLADRPHPPQADATTTRLLVQRVPSISAAGVEPKITALGLFDQLHHPTLIAAKARLARLTRETLEKLRSEYASDPTFRRDVMRAEKSAATKATTTTLALTRAMAATFFPDRKRVIKDNDALDWQHAVVSVAFCDFVLLDGATCDMVRRAQRMLPGVKMAKTFSESDGGIEHFIDTLGVAVA